MPGIPSDVKEFWAVAVSLRQRVLATGAFPRNEVNQVGKIWEDLGRSGSPNVQVSLSKEVY